MKNTEEQSFIDFLIKHWFVFAAGLIPNIIDFVKTGHIELDTLIGSLIAIFILSLCVWGASRLKI
jgi:hypothetical protein